MKNPFVRLMAMVCCLYTSRAVAQTDSVIDKPAVHKPCNTGDEDPRLENMSYSEFVRQNLHYPEEAEKAGIQGTVILLATVSAHGILTKIEVLQEVGGGCSEEAIRVVSLMRRWVPGKMNCQPVGSKITLRIKFSLWP